MTQLFHTGHAYAAFDRIVRAVETWLADRVHAIAGFEEVVVRERLAQRIVEIGLWPFVGICARHLEAGDTPVPPPEQSLDCGGVTLYSETGRAAISLRLFAYSFLEFGIHWLHVLGAILRGSLRRGAGDSRPATLVFGVGAESLFHEGSDSRFVHYCRAGPVAPLAGARRLIIQCLVYKSVATDPDFAYDHFPLHALIRDARLGLSGRAELLWAHLAAPFAFLQAILQAPLLALLARDIACAFVVKELDRRRMIEAVVITNAAYTTQPLWMRGPSLRRFPVHMVWYSQNTQPLVYARDGFVSDLPNYRHIRMDETWVWTSGYKNYLEKLGLAGPIHVVGPILWYLPESSQPGADEDIRVVLFDVTPVRDDVALRIGLIDNYYSAENMVRFIEDALAVCRELEEQAGKRVRLMLKHKRSYNHSHDQRYIDLIERLSSLPGGIELIPFQTNMYSLLASSNLSIVAPWSSPAYVANYIGVQAVYFDPIMELTPTFESAPHVCFASGREELLRIASEAFGAVIITIDNSVMRDKTPS